MRINTGRQFAIVALQRMTFAQLPTTVEKKAIFLPGGSVPLAVQIANITVSNGGTADVIDVGFLSGAANGLINDHDARTAAARSAAAATALGTVVAAGGDWITATRTEGGTAATAGEFLIIAEYAQDGRSQFDEGPDTDA